MESVGNKYLGGGARGNPAECPENTMASFRNAMEAVWT